MISKKTTLMNCQVGFVIMTLAISYYCTSKWQRMKVGFQKRKRIIRAYNQVSLLFSPCLNLDSCPIIANEMSIREPLFCDEDDDDNMEMYSCSDSSSCDDSEPENSSFVCWRAERLSREEFIAVCINVV